MFEEFAMGRTSGVFFCFLYCSLENLSHGKFSADFNSAGCEKTQEKKQLAAEKNHIYHSLLEHVSQADLAHAFMRCSQHSKKLAFSWRWPLPVETPRPS